MGDALRKFGEIAIAEGFCTRDQIEIALELIEEAALELKIGAFLKKGIITEEQVHRVLEIQKAERREQPSLDP